MKLADDDDTDPFTIVGSVGLGSVGNAGELAGPPSTILGSDAAALACAYTYGCLVGLGVGVRVGPGATAGHEFFHEEDELQ